MNTKKKTIRIALPILPLVFSLVSLFWAPALFVPLAILFLFVSVACFPAAHRRENLWMFFLAFPTMIPINIRLFLIFGEYLLPSETALRIVSSILAFCVLISVEEIVLGFITRMIWKRQYKWEG